MVMTPPLLVTIPDPAPETGRVPYRWLSEPERDALHAWVTRHRLPLKRVPIDPEIEFDRAHSEWRIRLFAEQGDRCFVDPDTGDIATVVVRRRALAPLPWPDLFPGLYERTDTP